MNEPENVIAVKWSDLVGGRLDAPFVLLSQKHKEAAKELAEKFTREELTALAKALPFNTQAAAIVWPLMPISGLCKGRSRVNENNLEKHCLGCKDENGVTKVSPTRFINIVVYVAAAAEDAVAKRLEELVEMKKQELAILNQQMATLDMVKAKGATKVLEIMKSEHRKKEVTDGTNP